MSPIKTILIIDDDEGVRKVLESILNRFADASQMQSGAVPCDKSEAQESSQESLRPPYNLILAKSGEEGVVKVTDSLINGRPVALVFIDMQMPGLNGAETAREIWRIDPLIKAVFITGYDDLTPRQIISVTGRRDHFYLRKPFSGEVIRQFALSLTDQWQLEQEREALAEELQRKNLELAKLNETLEEQVKVKSAILFQTEKMASIGILAAGVAHEINNPIAFVRSNLETLADYSSGLKKLILGYQEMAAAVVGGRTAGIVKRIEALRELEEQEQIDFALTDIEEMITESIEGANRISDIVKDLRYISRDDHEASGSINVNHLLDSVLTLIDHQMGDRITVQKQFIELPEIICFPQQLGQVFMHIILNATQAIKDRGTITVATRELIKGRRRSDNLVVITITDDGCGIGEDDLKKIFDPFFTTREVGSGTGLGLSLCHDIIKAHQGSIRVESEVGVGTTFTLQLPVESRGCL